MSGPQLFDEPGPVALRRHRILEGVAVLIVAAAVVGLVTKLSSEGFFAARSWAPLRQSGVWRLIGTGLWHNISAALVAMVLSTGVGVVLSFGLTAQTGAIRIACGSLTAVFNSIPVLLLLFFTSLTLPAWGLDLPDFWFLVIALTAYSGASIGDLVASGVQALPRGQSEAAAAVGFSPGRTMVTFLLPQAFRRMLPALVSQLVIIFKGTALAYVLGGYLELLHTTTVIGAYYSQSSLQALVIGAVLFMLVNIALQSVSDAIAHWERRRHGERAVAASEEALSSAMV